MDCRLSELYREFAGLLPGAATGDETPDYIEEGGFVLARVDDASIGCQVVALTDPNGAEVGASLQERESLMITVKIPAKGFSAYWKRLAGTGERLPILERGLDYTFAMKFERRSDDVREVAGETEGETCLVERIWLREIDGVSELARVLMGL